ncbi:MAG: ECF transporter S component [Oscillospiraceae bacterium]|jgi:niacin transporter|nr:ECF transporter S component [Oscillospiraceae bacterium]
MNTAAKIATKKIAFGGVIVAFAVLLPQAFHFTGVAMAGEVFLPMHIPVLIGGFALGPTYGFAVGAVSPVLSHFFTGMPMSFRLPFMILELGAYGFMSGFLYKFSRGKKAGIFITLVASMLFGRLVFALALIIAGDLLGVTRLGGVSFALAAVNTGIYGIIIQLTYIPTVVYSLERSGFLERQFRKSQETSR